MHSHPMIEAINDAIGAHGMWKMRLRTAIHAGHCELGSGTVCRDDQCAFGKWLHGPAIEPATKAGVPYGVVKRLHAEFHRTAGSVVAYVEQGDRAAAQALLDGEYAARSEKLVRALTKWKGELGGLRPGVRTAA